MTFEETLEEARTVQKRLIHDYGYLNAADIVETTAARP
tara:strand:+ start:937 stop:1050 length:114 start_codon:yes stop_codon:yes gene_type:complete